MSRSTTQRRLAWLGAGALGLIVSAGPGAGIAQPPAAAPPSQSAPVQPETPTSDPSVSELVITAPDEVPVPQIGPGAPLFSPAELAAAANAARQEASGAANNARRCATQFNDSNIMSARTIRELMAAAYRSQQQYQRAVYVQGQAAQEASIKARAARQAMARSEISEEQLWVSELQRQLAVRKYILAKEAAEDSAKVISHAQQLIRETAAMYDNPQQAEPTIVSTVRSQLRLPGADGRFPPGPPSVTEREYADLALEEVVVRQREDRRGVFLYVTGKIRNARTKAAPMPSLSVSAVDETGFPVKTETADGRGSIRPGQSIGFQYELRPKPLQAKTVVVTFVSRTRPPMTLPAGYPLVMNAPALNCGG